MKIIVSIKQVPARDSVLRITSDGRRIDEVGLGYEMNGPDAYALEAALQLRDRFGSEVVVVSAGPERVAKTIREALAKGAQRGIHVLISDGESFAPFKLARILAAAVKDEKPDLFLTGLQAEDSCHGETAVLVAGMLGYSHATIVTEVQPRLNEVRVKRELEDGWSQYVTLLMPAVLSIQSGQSKPRLATMMGIRQAKDKPLQVIAVTNLDKTSMNDLIIERLSIPPRLMEAQIFTGEARDCARRLIAQLQSEARLL